DAAGDHPDRRRQRAFVRGTVDPARETRDDREPRLGERVREVARELDRRGRGVARADDGGARPGREGYVAADGQDRRRAFECREKRRISGGVVEQIVRPRGPDSGNLVLYPRDWRRAIVAPSASGQLGERFERRQRRAEPAQELGVGDRADVGRAEQADAGERFVLREARRRAHLPAPTLGSVPARSRAMLLRWSQATSAAIAASTGTNSMRPVAAAAIGAATAALIPLTEEIRVAASIASQTTA